LEGVGFDEPRVSDYSRAEATRTREASEIFGRETRRRRCVADRNVVEIVNDKRLGHWAVVVADVVVAVGGDELSLAGVLVAWLSFAGASTMTILVLVEIRPVWSVTT